MQMCWITSFRASVLANIVSTDSFKVDRFPKSTFNKVVLGFTIEKDNWKETSSPDKVKEESFNKVDEVQHLESWR